MGTEQKTPRQAIDRLIEQLFNGYRQAERPEPPPASPYLYQRVRQRIEAEKRRRLEEGGSWALLLLEAKHVLPVLTVIAAALIGLAASTPNSPMTPPGHGIPSLPTFGLLATEIPPFSNDEMMASAVE